MEEVSSMKKIWNHGRAWIRFQNVVTRRDFPYENIVAIGLIRNKVPDDSKAR
jgi:hypothetical protein